MAYRIGIDIGGTFTDFALVDEGGGRLVIHKQLTSPDDPARAVLDGLPVLLARAGAEMSEVASIAHGTTLVTNALIERRGAVTGMLCTAGFADVLDIGMERRYDMYDLAITYPKPLVPKACRAEIDERVAFDGRVIQEPDLEAVRAAIARLVDEHGIEALAICLLNAYANPVHEERIGALTAEAFPDLRVSTSADVFPFMREYERWTTTTVNAFTQPMVERYLDRLEAGLADHGFPGAFYIMTSSGGTVTPAVARRYPVRLLESGPAAGALMSAYHGQALGRPELLAFDMGGTTAKGALIREGTPLKKYELEIARVHEFKAGSGLPVKAPAIDLIEIGAGGGSIAEIDVRGVMRVGPTSAGADPGPACYGRGGAAATLTDANLCLGYLDPDYFLGGEMALDGAASGSVIDRHIAGPLEVDAIRAAWGIHETVNEDVARAFRNHASERGFDYRRSAMIAFGGSGPAHALRVARKLRVPTVIFPLGAGVMSAVGLLASPLAFELMRSERVAVEGLADDTFADRFAALSAQAAAPLVEAGMAAADIAMTRWLDMRYQGQGYDVEVRLPDGNGAAKVAALPALFGQAYEAVFGRSFPDEAVDIMSWKVEARGPRPALDGRLDRAAPEAAGDPIKGMRRAYFPEAGGFVDCPVYDRYALTAGASFSGPALVEERESTCVIGVGDTVEVASASCGTA
jgi:N-methylhydantoinase A